MIRRKTREVRVGNLVVGGHNPIWVQSMTVAKTHDFENLKKEIDRLVDAGCEIIRVACFDDKDRDALPTVKKICPVPLVADIHFRFRYAIDAINAGVDKVRINPGNVGGFENFRTVVRHAKEKGVSMRIGVNSGSVEKDLLEKYGYPTSEAMVESALRYIDIAEKEKYYDLIISLKSTALKTCIENYRLFSKKSDYPVHIGVTEAGMGQYGIVKSSIGLGTLLMEGIGDTIRVSLVGDPVQEISVCYDILKATGARVKNPEIIACPSCGRIAIDLEKHVNQVTEKLKAAGYTKPVRISILGCAVNGPGEAAEADYGIAGGKGEGLIFKHGKIVKKVKEDILVEEFVKIILTDNGAN